MICRTKKKEAMKASDNARESAEKRRTEFFCRTSPLPRIFGILNLTEDSFSDGGMHGTSPSDAAGYAEKLLDDGADAIDIGAESTRPGAKVRPEQEEISLLVPAVREIRKRRPDAVLSIDTRKATVADAVLSAGADIINDVSSFQFDSSMPQTVASHPGTGVILMHMRGTPETMQSPENLVYADLSGEINSFFTEKIGLAVKAGIPAERIILDPGIGFAKTPLQNLALIHSPEAFDRHRRPLLYGISRKSFLRTLDGSENAMARDPGTAGVLAYLAERHVAFVRVHNVAAARSVMRCFAACVSGVIPPEEGRAVQP